MPKSVERARAQWSSGCLRLLLNFISDGNRCCFVAVGRGGGINRLSIQTTGCIPQKFPRRIAFDLERHYHFFRFEARIYRPRILYGIKIPSYPRRDVKKEQV